ncbi:hypothetical protein KY284_012957 [Solanum tuberosum]|nr:hypothetical protein KY284_012957 [Solanum tuberosum]
MWVEGQALVAAEAELFFQDQFSDRRAEVELTLLDHIPTVINDVENEMINSLPTFEEVKTVVFELNGDSASGPRAGHKYRKTETPNGTEIFCILV